MIFLIEAMRSLVPQQSKQILKCYEKFQILRNSGAPPNVGCSVTPKWLRSSVVSVHLEVSNPYLALQVCHEGITVKIDTPLVHLKSILM